MSLNKLDYLTPQDFYTILKNYCSIVYVSILTAYYIVASRVRSVEEFLSWGYKTKVCSVKKLTTF